MSVTTTYYSVDNGTTWHRYDPTKQPAFPQDGSYMVKYFSTDRAGHRESIKSVSFKIDGTRPTITFSGNQDSYTIDEQVTITCTAEDPIVNGSRSGLASATCPSISAPAWSLGLGSHTVSAVATDNAGNRTDLSITFTITVTFDSLCTLTQRLVGAKNPGLARAMCNHLEKAKRAAASGNRVAEEAAIHAYDQNVNAARAGGWITEEQANLLTSLAKTL